MSKIHRVSEIEKSKGRGLISTRITKCGVWPRERYATRDIQKVTCTICLGQTRPRGRKKAGTGMNASPGELRTALRAIYTAVRGDEKSEYWTLRKYLDKHGVFNDDLQDGDRLIEVVCRLALRIT